MDIVTHLNDTASTIAQEANALEKKLVRLSQTVAKEVGQMKQDDPKAIVHAGNRIWEELQNFASEILASSFPKHIANLELLGTLNNEKDDETWLVLSSGERLSASRTVDEVTDVITSNLLKASQEHDNSQKNAFADNPDNFVAEFVAKYLDHGITDRMSDMVISLVTDWIRYKLG